MSWEQWLVLAVVVFVATIIPGPACLLSLAHGIRYGLRRAWFTILGICLASIMQAGVSIAGLGALMAASVPLFTAVKICGGLYLIWAGWAMFRAGELNPLAGGRGPDAGVLNNLEHSPDRGFWNLFRQGLLMGLSNPKAIIFYTALFPQFIAEKGPGLAHGAGMLGVVCFMSMCGMLPYAAGGHSLATLFRRPFLRRHFNKGVGSLFIGSGVCLAASRN